MRSTPISGVRAHQPLRMAPDGFSSMRARERPRVRAAAAAATHIMWPLPRSPPRPAIGGPTARAEAEIGGRTGVIPHSARENLPPVPEERGQKRKKERPTARECATQQSSSRGLMRCESNPQTQRRPVETPLACEHPTPSTPAARATTGIQPPTAAWAVPARTERCLPTNECKQCSSAAERKRRTQPTTERAGRAANRATAPTAHGNMATRRWRRPRPNWPRAGRKRHARFGDATPTHSPRPGADVAT